MMREAHRNWDGERPITFAGLRLRTRAVESARLHAIEVTT